MAGAMIHPTDRRIVFVLLGVCAFGQWLPAHGGQYLGPAAVVPPAPSNASGSTGGSIPGGNGSSGSATSGSGTTSGPSTSPASSSPAGTLGSRATSRSRGAALDDDLGRWEFWWEFGKDPWLRLREVIYDGRRPSLDDAMLSRGPMATGVPVQRPSEADLDATTEALATALRAARDRDTVSSFLVALAKV